MKRNARYPGQKKNERHAGGTWTLLLAVCFMLSVIPAFGEELPWLEMPAGEIHPWRTAVFYYTVPEAGPCSLEIRAEDGSVVSVVSRGHEANAGRNNIHWNGTHNGEPAPAGQWRLFLEQNGRTAEVPVSIGEPAPRILGAGPEPAAATRGSIAGIHYYATDEGTLDLLGPDGSLLVRAETAEGNGRILFPVDLESGEHPLTLVLTDGEGIASEPATVLLKVAGSDGTPEPTPEPMADETPEPSPEPMTEETPKPVIDGSLETMEDTAAAAPDPRSFTPSLGSPWAGRDTAANYWTVPMDITDEAAVWKALTAPMTVIDNGKTEKAQIVIRSGPSQESPGVGSVTCQTQGVHVLERGEEWSLIECYSSSFHNSPILNWNALVQGYVPTRFLTEVLPDQEMGYVIDKLTQRMYIFREGHLFSTLLVSTGLSNARQPYNETRSGEFLMTSKVGTFLSDNLSCGLAIRFNKGDLLHEVPHILQADGTRSYKSCEPKLGTKASHGCIRVQRKTTPEGVNMSWIWENHRKNIRLMIWEDWQGRQIPLPAEDLQVYYNPRGGQYYHSQERCSSVSRADLIFTAFPYGDLDQEPYSKLERCEYCTPPLRKAEIEQINAVYAAGEDHDPVLTKARENCPQPLK